MILKPAIIENHSGYTLDCLIFQRWRRYTIQRNYILFLFSEFPDLVKLK